MDDDLWALIEPLLPPWPERSPGPKPVADRLCLEGILYVLHQDVAWQLLPLEPGFGSGQTCRRRLDRWQQAGVFDRLDRILLAELNAAGELDWTRACVDGTHGRAKEGETRPAMGTTPRTPRRLRLPGLQLHLLATPQEGPP
ncbi:transposase [Streptomyces asoensis]|uniref:Transposase n=1 Tax=Streptomyces asoensis TaxID=249586 RepID=A0A6M4WRV8_9ACTN|nr:transposase [Streptomyces asoensis]QJS99032.1 transposase [Streptomyces asoensis]